MTAYESTVYSIDHSNRAAAAACSSVRISLDLRVVVLLVVALCALSLRIIA